MSMTKKKTEITNNQRLTGRQNAVALELDGRRFERSKESSILRMNAAMLKARHDMEAKTLLARHDLERAALKRQHQIEQTDMKVRMQQHRAIESRRQASLSRALGSLIKRSENLAKSAKK